MNTRQTTMLDFLHGFHRKTRHRVFLEMMDWCMMGKAEPARTGRNSLLGATSKSLASEPASVLSEATA